MIRTFQQYHPFTILIYFCMMIFFTMMQTHPITLLLLFVCSVWLYATCTSIANMVKQMKGLMMIFIVIALTNPLFVHQGVTILCYVNDNPITLEAILYGCAFALTIITVLLQCQIFHMVMSNDRILYVCSRILPKSGLILSMSLQMLPKFQRHAKELHQVQYTLGQGENSLPQRITASLREFSMVITWALETSVITADSMKARGYGTHKRSSFSMFLLTQKDLFWMILHCLLALVLLLLYRQIYAHFYYYPSVTPITWTNWDWMGMTSILLLFLFPAQMAWRKERIWHSVK